MCRGGRSHRRRRRRRVAGGGSIERPSARAGHLEGAPVTELVPAGRVGDGEGDIRAAETLARWLDDRFLDPLLGLVLPGVGDVVGSALGLYVVGVALRRRLPLVTVARMLMNLGVDALVGAVPLAGDLFDI